MGRQWNLYDRTFFQTECTEAKWDEEAARWICTTDQGDVFRARFLIAASGPLHKPKLPQTPGIGSFKGVMFHTSVSFRTGRVGGEV